MSSKIKKQDIHALWEQNPNLKPRLEKVTVNIAIGTSGEILTKAATVLETMTEQKPQYVGAKKSIKDFGIRKGENIAVKVTLRGDKADLFLRKVLVERDFRLLRKSIDHYGNMSFGIKEHINVPGIKYDPNVGIFGFDVSIRLYRPGYRVHTRKVRKAKIPKKQYVSKEEMILFLEEYYKVEVVDKIEVFYY
jgi:large subunit ribosomal protein L5